MASNYSPRTINRKLGVNLRAIRTTAIRGEDARQALGGLLQSALQLEFATIPTYLSAAFSLTSSNRKISDLILRAAVEEMLHMTAVANLMNAIGIAPDIIAAVPAVPHHLTVLEPPLKLDLRSFSFDVEGVDLVRLLSALPPRFAYRDLPWIWRDHIPLATGSRIASWLWDRSVLVQAT